MKKILGTILGIMILLVVLIIYGCATSNFRTISDHSKVLITANDANDSTGNATLTIPDGSALNVEAEIKKGKLILWVAGTEHVVDKSGEISIDVPAGNCELNFIAKDGLTGEITLRPLPKV